VSADRAHPVTIQQESGLLGEAGHGRVNDFQAGNARMLVQRFLNLQCQHGQWLCGELVPALAAKWESVFS
jgi:hypothetical protein